MDSKAILELDVFRNILDSVDSGLALLDSEYTLLYSNSHFNTLLKEQQKSLLGTKVYLNKGLNIKQLQGIQQQINSDESWQGVFPEIGMGLKVSVSRVKFSIPTSLTHLSKAYFILTISDHSAALRQQQELLEAKSLVEKSDKAKTEFFSQMSHELRTPLNAIIGFTQLLRMGSDLSNEQQDNLQEITSSSDHLLKLINETLDKSRAEQGSLKLFSENINLQSLISECITLVGSLAQKHNIQIVQHPSTLTLLNDRVRLKQVLINLLSNAIKYNNNGGKVIIRCFITPQYNIRIEIQDSGMGFSQQLLSTIFKPFERLNIEDKKVKDTGIGLMITRRLVKKMNGTVNALSKPGSGSIFSLEFPATATTINEANTAFFNETRNILWIGDEANIYEFAKSLTNLRPALEFHHADNITCAIQAPDKLKPDLIFLTTKEPFASLTHSSPNIEFFFKDIPIVAVITSELLIEEQLDLNLGFAAYLSAPMQAIDFMGILDHQLCQQANGII